MYEKILVPLDGSKLSEIALPYAEELAARLGSEITLLSVSISAEAKPYNQRLVYIGKMKETAEHGLERYLRQPKAEAIRVESAVLVGHPAENIVDYADEEDMSLIVMATHGQSGIRRWAMGSVADKVVSATKRPVALIRAKTSHVRLSKKGILRKVLVPLDGSPESEAVIPHVRELGNKLGFEVTLLQVNEQMTGTSEADSKSYLETMADIFNNAGIVTSIELRAGDGAEEIIRLAGEIRADIVAMSTHGRSGVRRWVFGSVAARVLHAGDAPVLLVRASQS